MDLIGKLSFLLISISSVYIIIPYIYNHKIYIIHIFKMYLKIKWGGLWSETHFVSSV